MRSCAGSRDFVPHPRDRSTDLDLWCQAFRCLADFIKIGTQFHLIGTYRVHSSVVEINTATKATHTIQNCKPAVMGLYSNLIKKNVLKTIVALKS